MKNTGLGHLKTRLFTIKTSKNVGLGGPWIIPMEFPRPKKDPPFSALTSTVFDLNGLIRGPYKWPKIKGELSRYNPCKWSGFTLLKTDRGPLCEEISTQGIGKDVPRSQRTPMGNPFF